MRFKLTKIITTLCFTLQIILNKATGIKTWIKPKISPSMKCVHILSQSERDPCLALGIIEVTPRNVKEEIYPIKTATAGQNYYDVLSHMRTVSIIGLMALWIRHL